MSQQIVAEPGGHEIRIIREYDAPRDLVYRAFTEPDLLARWWGEAGSTTVVEALEARPGGRWRYVNKDSDGEYGFFGVFHDAVAPERLVYTFEYEPMPGLVLLETILLAELGGGRTRLVDSSVYPSVAARDEALPGVEGGTEALDRLADLLATI